MLDVHKKPVNIFIAEWVPSLNKGELAILVGIIRTFEILGPVRVSVLSFYPEIDRVRYPDGIEVVDAEKDLFIGKRFPEKSLISRFLLSLFVGFQHLLFVLTFSLFREKIRGIWREYIDADIIIVGHDQIDCAMGFYLLFHPVVITLINKVIHKKVVIYGNGSSSSRFSNILLPFVLLNADLITTREESTYNFYKKIVSGRVPLFLTADPAILVKPSEADRVNSIMNKENIIKGRGPLIGMALSHQVLKHSVSNSLDCEARYSQRTKLLSELIDYLIDNFDASIVFLPHCIEPYRNLDDRVVAEDIYNLVKNKQRLYRINNEYSPQELKGLVGQFDIVISTRVHALVNTASMCVPFICLKCAHDERVQGILGTMFGQGDWILNVDNLKFEELCQKTATLLSLKDKVRKDLALKLVTLEKKAMLNGKLLNLMR
ncbi:MAG: polysaccharide pyruvyl transferase family protein [Promethearchaeota archaeon]